jgi:hypothetical protein
MRAEGLTELTGDIVLDCRGGTPTLAGTDPLTALPINVPRANVSVFYGGTTVTSRDTGDGTEALLLIDEPTVNVPGSSGAFQACTSVGGCNVVATSTSPGLVGPNPYAQPGAFNVFQGTATGNAVTFLGVPIDPPGTSGSRIIRITNVRINANAFAGTAGVGGATGAQVPVQAFISISGPTSVPISNPQLTVGFVQNGLAFSVRNASNGDPITTAQTTFQQCVSQDRVRFAVLRYAEGFATSFRLRGTNTQSSPGTIYNTESGLTGVPGVHASTGLADFATRVKAVFNNVPAGVRIYAATQNVRFSSGAPAALVAGDPVATMVSGEGLNAIPVPSSETRDTVVPVVELVPVAGTVTAVWEVTSANPFAVETLNFPLYIRFSADVANNTPAPTPPVGTVSGSFAPTYAPTGSAIGSQDFTWPIPRFATPTGSSNLLNIALCRTNLLFPFVVNTGAGPGGIDTGLAISNTSRDPFGTGIQSGNCTLTLYGTGLGTGVDSLALAPKAVAAGQSATWLMSTDAPAGFTGYVIAQCNFQLAHGLAFISDYGLNTYAMGYLALIIPDPARMTPAGGEALDQ